MSTRLFSEIANLKRVILALGAMAEAAVHDAACAIENRDERLAQNVIHNDARLDNMEIRIEEDCFKTTWQSISPSMPQSWPRRTPSGFRSIFARWPARHRTCSDAVWTPW